MTQDRKLVAERKRAAKAGRPQGEVFRSEEVLAALLEGSAARVRAYGERTAMTTFSLGIDGVANRYSLEVAVDEVRRVLDRVEDAEAEARKAGRLG